MQILVPIIRKDKILSKNYLNNLHFICLYLKISEYINEKNLIGFFSFMNTEELLKIQRLYHNPQRQIAVTAGRFFSKWLVLDENLKCFPSSVEFKNISILNSKKDHGCPYIKFQNRILADSLSISYSNDNLLLGYSREYRIGVDLETSVSMEKNFLEYVFSDLEREGIYSSTSGLSKEKNALLFWCMKEAILKAVGKGFTEGCQAIEIFINKRNKRLEIIDKKHLLNSDKQLWLYYDIQQELCSVICVLE